MQHFYVMNCIVRPCMVSSTDHKHFADRMVFQLNTLLWRDVLKAWNVQPHNIPSLRSFTP
jgi:hypothetical protein